MNISEIKNKLNKIDNDINPQRSPKFLPRIIDTIFVMLGHECNFQCKYCLQHPLTHGRIKHEMNPDIIDFIKQLLETQNNHLSVHFYGGEPLLFFDNIKEIVEKLKKYNFPNLGYSTITNGSLITDEMVDFFNENKLHVCISHDGPTTKETRLHDVFEDKELKARIFKIKRLGTSSVISAYNSPYETLKYFEKLQNEYKKIHGPESMLDVNFDEIMDTGLDDKTLIDVDYDFIFNDYTKICNEFKSIIKDEDLTNVFKRFALSKINQIKYNANKYSIERFTCACSNGYRVLNLSLDGNLYRCHNSDEQIGDIYSDYFEYISNVISWDDTKEYNKKCKECDVQVICQNGCPLIKDEVRKESYCKMKRASFLPFLNLIIELGDEAKEELEKQLAVAQIEKED